MNMPAFWSYLAVFDMLCSHISVQTCNKDILRFGTQSYSNCYHRTSFSKYSVCETYTISTILYVREE